nr:MAG TPA: antitoxin [Caudoviricetes sp.]
MQLRLKELREDLGISVKDMARDTGVLKTQFTCMREVDIHPLSKLK